MEIKTSDDLIFSWQSLQFVFDIEDLWMEYLRRISPSSIQVHSWNITPTVAIYHSIYIDHGINEYCVVFNQELDLSFIFLLLFVGAFNSKSWKLFKNLLHQVRWNSLSWMLSCHQDDHFLLVFIVFLFTFGGGLRSLLSINRWRNLYFWQIISTKGPSQSSYFHVGNLFVFIGLFELLGELVKIIW